MKLVKKSHRTSHKTFHIQGNNRIENNRKIDDECERKRTKTKTNANKVGKISVKCQTTLQSDNSSSNFYQTPEKCSLFAEENANTFDQHLNSADASAPFLLYIVHDVGTLKTSNLGCAHRRSPQISNEVKQLFGHL